MIVNTRCNPSPSTALYTSIRLILKELHCRAVYSIGCIAGSTSQGIYRNTYILEGTLQGVFWGDIVGPTLQEIHCIVYIVEVISQALCFMGHYVIRDILQRVYSMGTRIGNSLTKHINGKVYSIIENQQQLTRHRSAFIENLFPPIYRLYIYIRTLVRLSRNTIRFSEELYRFYKKRFNRFRFLVSICHRQVMEGTRSHSNNYGYIGGIYSPNTRYPVDNS